MSSAIKKAGWHPRSIRHSQPADEATLGAIINHNPALKDQLVLLFADSGHGANGRAEHIHWDKTEPKDHVSEHVPASPKNPSLVQVSNQRKLSPIDQCVSVSYTHLTL